MDAVLPSSSEAPTATQTANESAGSPDAEKAKRKRQPRNSACQPCASLKMKCVASSEPGKCERCWRMNRECIPAIPKPRKRRAESGVGAEVLGAASLVDGIDDEAAPPGQETQRPSSRRKSTFDATLPINSLLSRPDIRHNGSRTFTTLLAQGLRIDGSYSAYGDLLQALDYNHVQNSLTIFRQYTVHFPFVNIPVGTDSLSLIVHRPLMATALCTVTAAANPDMQARLSQAVRLALSTRAIVEGERSMDLLMGLLIFVAWHHHYLYKQQIYQYLCLLRGMATDLGLYEDSSAKDVEDRVSAAERDRAFLGCYYLCSGLSMRGFKKPSPLRWTDNLHRNVENLVRSGSQPSDQMIISLVELARIKEDMDKALQAQLDLRARSIATFVDLQSKASQHRLKRLKTEHPPVGNHLGFVAATIGLQDGLLTATSTPDTSALIQCAVSVKEYLDDLFARPPFTLHQIAIVDWTNLLAILMIMARLSKPSSNGNGWESGALTSMLQPESILENVSAHMASASTGDVLTPRHELLVQWFRAFCGSIKMRMLYDRSSINNGKTPGEHSSSDIGGRFRPANNGIGVGEDLPSPYNALSAADGLTGWFVTDGILDESFLNTFMGRA